MCDLGILSEHAGGGIPLMLQRQILSSLNDWTVIPVVWILASL